MHKLMITLAVLLTSSVAMAQRRGAYFSANVGPGYTMMTSSEADASIYGPSISLDLRAGAVVAPHVVLFGTAFADLIQGPTMESGGNVLQTEENVSASLSGIGAGIAVNLMHDFYIAASACLPMMRIAVDDIDIAESNIGVGGRVVAGKEWKAGPFWTLGASAQAFGGMIPDSNGEQWATISASVGFSASWF